MMKLRTLDDIDVTGKRVLLRADFNVPISGERIAEPFRIEAALPTIYELISRGCSVIIVSHLGRPSGTDPALSLAPVAKHLGKLLKKDIPLLDMKSAHEELESMEPGEVWMLENIRFYPEEEKNDDKFAKALSALGEVFVNDAFGTAHRAHASTHAITKYLPSCAGRLLEKETQMLRGVLAHPEPPLVAIIGGAKVSSKIGLLKMLLNKADILVVGGAMANTFFAAQGIDIGSSVYEEEMVEEAEEILSKSHYKGSELLLPQDAVVSNSLKESGRARKISDFIEVEKDEYIVDVGPVTLDELAEPIKMAGTIIWNGPLGINEVSKYAKGTEELAKMIVKSKATKIVGGGETLLTVFKLKLEDKFDLVSTGGGAMLDFIEGKEMPALEVLSD